MERGSFETFSCKGVEVVGILEEGILLVLVVAFFFFSNLFFALAHGGDERGLSGLSRFGETVELWLGHLLLL